MQVIYHAELFKNAPKKVKKIVLIFLKVRPSSKTVVFIASFTPRELCIPLSRIHRHFEAHPEPAKNFSSFVSFTESFPANFVCMGVRRTGSWF